MYSCIIECRVNGDSVHECDDSIYVSDKYSEYWYGVECDHKLLSTTVGLLTKRSSKYSCRQITYTLKILNSKKKSYMIA